MTSATPAFVAGRTETRARLRNDSATRTCSSVRTTRTEPPPDQSARSCAACLVDGVSKPDGSRIAIVPRSAWTESALRSAARRSLRLTLNVYLRGWGPNTMPPPVQIGDRDEPARARPVPFWRHGLAPPPETRPRVLVAAVPWRRALSSARTDSCTSGPLKRAPKATSSSLTFLDLAAPRTGASPADCLRPSLPPCGG